MKTKLQLLTSILIIGFLFNSNIFAQYGGGSGTEVDPYNIYTENDLYDLTLTSSDWDKHFIQIADLDFTGTAAITPIGLSATEFTGSYNGQGHTITNLTVDHSSSNKNFVGLFGFITDVTIKNLGLINVTVTGQTAIGGLVGYAEGNSLIEDCYVTGSVTSSSEDNTSRDVGGLIGTTFQSVLINNCYSECSVSSDGEYGVGGFIGRSVSSASITNCYSTGNVTDNGSSSTYSYWGGFVGYSTGGIISNCFATGDVLGSNSSGSSAGGFVGYNYGGNIELCHATGNVSNATNVGGFVGTDLSSSTVTSTIFRSYSVGDVSSSSSVGGFIGKLYGAELENCYSLGNVTTSSGNSNGGFCGYIYDAATIKHSYSTGNVTYSSSNDPTDKGFVGSESSFTGSYDANFFNTTTSNQTTATGATGKSHDDMNDGQTYSLVSAPDTPWDVKGVQGAGSNDYWEMESSINSGYPFLRAQYSTSTKTATSITDNSATSGGNVFDNGSRNVSERGVCWSTSTAPTTADSKEIVAGTTGDFSVNLTGLSASTTYYMRAYVTNNVGTSYGDEETFATQALAPVELTMFTATSASSATIVLNWTTATEVNNYGFEVQRLGVSSQISEKEWATIAFVDGHGNSNSPKDYSFIDTDISVTERSRSYRLKQIDIDGAFEYSDVVTVELKEKMEYKLAQNHPNPFNPTTQISFTISKAGIVKLSIYNVLGEVVAELVNKNLEAGSHQYQFDATNLTSGIYFYSISVNGFTQVKKMNLIK